MVDITLEQAIRLRDDACDKVGAWWRAGSLDNQFRDHTKAPAWPEYLAACSALYAIIDKGE